MNRLDRLPRALQPARSGGVATIPKQEEGSQGRHLLIIDLNNFASFPTLAIGILVSALRARQHQVEVLCPLAHDVLATQRERRETLVDHTRRRIHLSDWRPFLGLRDILRRLETTRVERAHPVVLREIRKALATPPMPF